MHVLSEKKCVVFEVPVQTRRRSWVCISSQCVSDISLCIELNPSQETGHFIIHHPSLLRFCSGMFYECTSKVIILYWNLLCCDVIEVTEEDCGPFSTWGHCKLVKDRALLLSFGACCCFLPSHSLSAVASMCRNERYTLWSSSQVSSCQPYENSVLKNASYWQKKASPSSFPWGESHVCVSMLLLTLGEFVATKDGEYLENFTPATNEVSSLIARSKSDDIDRGVFSKLPILWEAVHNV